MNTKLLSEAGAALYGPRWQSELARALNVSDRTMRRWLAADAAPAAPALVYFNLLSLVRRKQQKIRNIADRIVELM